MKKDTLKFWEKIEKETTEASTWRYTAPDPFQVFVDNIIDESNQRIKQLCFELAKETTCKVVEEVCKYFDEGVEDHEKIIERIFDKVWAKKIKELENEIDNH